MIVAIKFTYRRGSAAKLHIKGAVSEVTANLTIKDMHALVANATDILRLMENNSEEYVRELVV